MQEIADDMYRPKLKVYASEEAAIRRIERLQQFGFWPGYIESDEGFILTYDPPDIALLNSHGYLES